MWSRRAFIKSAGTGFAASLLAPAQQVLAQSEQVFASAVKLSDGRFAAKLLNEHGASLATIALPARGHDVTQCPTSGRLVAFARRPGTFAVVFDQQGRTLKTITSPEGRHFYGHGVFAPDGKLLYTTENDFEAGVGVIGIYDATDNFRRIGEFDALGTGPHDLLLSPDGRHLIIANGGIQTHPDYGRQKLNIATMEPSLVFLDRDTGTLAARHILPADWHQLSLRHLAASPDGTFWIGGQYQGNKGERIPLAARFSIDEELDFSILDDAANNALANYVGSVATSNDGQWVVFTSPVGNVAIMLETSTGTLKTITRKNVCGATFASTNVALSTGAGEVSLNNPDGTGVWDRAGYFFDNHLIQVR